MTRRFRRHYSRDEARALLPRVKTWLEELRQHRAAILENETRLARRLEEGDELGGPPVHNWLRALVGFKRVFREFQAREIVVKDLDRGLVDFPAVIGDREVFLCWEEGESDIEYWHDLDSGYAGREPL